MCTVVFEEVFCRSGRGTRANWPHDKYRLVLPTTNDRKEELKSTYLRGAGVFGWTPPFEAPIFVRHPESPIAFEIELRGKRLRDISGRSACLYTLSVAQDCVSTTFRLQATKSSMESPPDLSVTVTVVGIRGESAERRPEADPAIAAPSIANEGSTRAGSSEAPGVHRITVIDPSVSPSSKSTSHPSSAVPLLHISVPDETEMAFSSPMSDRPEQNGRDTMYANRTPGVTSSLPALNGPGGNNALLSLAQNASRTALSEQLSVKSRSRAPSDTSVDAITPNAESGGRRMWSGVSRLDSVVEVIDAAANIHPLAKGAWSLLNVAYTLAKQQSDLDTKIEDLVHALDANCEFAKVLSDNEITGVAESIIESILREVLNGATLIKEYCGVRKSKTSVFKFVGSGTSTQVDACLEALDILRRDLGDHITAGIHQDLQALGATLSRDLSTIKAQNNRIYDYVQAKEYQELLGQMQCAPEADRAMGNAEPGCLRGTRGEMIETIVNWAIGAGVDASQSYVPGLRPDSRVLWLCGVAGSGKSSIAISVARALDAMDRLGALYAFEVAQQHNLQLHPTNLFSTIARQLARRQPRFGQALIRILEGMNHGSRTTKKVVDQFNHFLISPSSEGVAHDKVIIIDAFDEAGSPEARKAALDALTPFIDNLGFPRGLRFIVTSRYDPDVAERLESLLSNDVPQPMVSVLRMDQIQSAHTQRDIQRYVTNALGGVFGLTKARNAGDLDRLAQAAKGSFLWASTACRFITAKDDRRVAYTPAARLKDALATGGVLDHLYRTILDQSFATSITEPSEILRTILGTLVCSFEPVSVNTICALAGVNVPEEDFDAEGYQIIVRSLASLITGTHDPTAPLLPLHTSFTDFLRDPKRSQDYAVAWPAMHLQLSMASFAVMKTSLRFNICGFESSFLRNTEVPDLERRVHDNIPPELSYTCRFWPAHVAAFLSSESVGTAPILRSLSEFLGHRIRVLEWLEVMSLTETDAHQSLSPLASLQIATSDLSDVIAFTTYFAIPLRTSVPHIYLSSLAFAPSSSLFGSLPELFPNLVRVSAPLVSWPRILHSLEHKLEVECIAFSPDGKYIVAGEHPSYTWVPRMEQLPGALTLWDVHSGEKILPRMTTRVGVVSVAFSPDGKLLATGHYDEQILLWDVRTLSTIGDPLCGHTGQVKCVAFSPDGALLASGSYDHTVRLWDTRTRHAVGEPLKHSGTVYCLALSPDGVLLASCVHDKTIQLWDTRTLSAVGDPLEGHTSMIHSITFSPDGTLLASGAWDHAVRLWDVQTRSALGEPLVAHKDLVRGVSFSPDGTRLASCSDDNTIQLWDVRSQAAIGVPLTGHNRRVVCVAFSPDGNLLASGSHDHTLRIWDARPLAAHETPYAHVRRYERLSPKNVAWSPHAHILASEFPPSYRTNTCASIQLWDTRAMSIVGHLSTGSTMTVTRLEFSPDGGILASVAENGEVQLWDVSACSPVDGPIGGQSGSVDAITFSPDGLLLAIGFSSGTLTLWDIHARYVLVQLAAHSASISSLAFSPDGTLLATGSSDRSIRLWDVRTCSSVGRPLEVPIDQVDFVTFSPDGALLASGIDRDSGTWLWDVNAQCAIRHFAGSARRVAFSSDSALLASAGDGRIRIWDARSSPDADAPIANLPDLGTDMSLEFDNDAPLLTTTSWGGITHIWDLRPLEALMTYQSSDDPQSQSEELRSLLPGHADLRKLSPECLRKLDDGWIVGPNRELILWVPPVFRPSLSHVLVTERFGGSPLVRLNFSKFVCGSDWTNCYSPPPSSP